MAVTAQDIKKLREATNCGILDCKKALTESEGDFDAAVDILRKKGQAKAVKKAGREANEGIVVAKVDGNKAALVQPKWPFAASFLETSTMKEHGNWLRGSI